MLADLYDGDTRLVCVVAVGDAILLRACRLFGGEGVEIPAPEGTHRQRTAAFNHTRLSRSDHSREEYSYGVCQHQGTVDGEHHNTGQPEHVFPHSW